MNKLVEIVESTRYYDGLTLPKRMVECRTPAVSIALVESFEITDTYTHGVRRRGKGNTVAADTIFQAASISKPVFAAAVMRLVERSVLDLDRDVADYLADFSLPTFDNQHHKITLRQLLSHHGGLNLGGFNGYHPGQKIPTVDQILRGAHPANHIILKIETAPEAGFSYSGGGYMLAQKIVTEVCKADFCDLLDELVLFPLAMARSTFAQPLPVEKRENAAYGYNDYNLQLPGGSNIMPELAAAGLWSTPTDLARFGIEIMRALKGESDFLSQKSAEMMTTPAYEGSPYGVGFSNPKSGRGPTFGHGGTNVGFHSHMGFCPADGTGMVVMQNSDIGSSIRGEVANAFCDVYDWWPLAERRWG